MFRATAASSSHSEVFARYCQSRSAMPARTTMDVTVTGEKKTPDRGGSASECLTILRRVKRSG
jgi:hypothetical protein